MDINERSFLDWLFEEPGKTVFEGSILERRRDNGNYYDVVNGGWLLNSDKGPETTLAIDILGRFKGKKVRVTIEELGEGQFR